ncbi:MAG: hypothetical protein N4A72_09930 [Bacteroidales bacterium]|nr:hypothetical protein [Bacteroidales bacterium]
MPDNKKYTIILLLLTLMLPGLYGQFKYKEKNDTLHIKKNNYLQFSDTIIYVASDTVFITNKDADINILSPGEYYQSYSFYDTLKTKANKYWLTRVLSDALIKEHRIEKGTKNITSPTLMYESHRGKRINDITIVNIPILPDSISGTALKKLLHYIVMSSQSDTPDKLIEKYIYFNKGDYTDPDLIASNQKLLREQSFISDADIILKDIDSTNVNAVVIVQNAWSKAFNADISSDNVRVEITDKNAFSSGNEYSLAFIANEFDKLNIGYNAIFDFKNIKHTLIGTKIDILSTTYDKTYKLAIYRNAIQNITDYFGAISALSDNSYNNLLLPDTIIERFHTKKKNIDFWIGHSFRLPNSRKISTSFRAYFNNIDYENIVKIDRQSYKNTGYLLIDLSISKQQYHQASMINFAGKTEDIPLGYQFTVTGGIEKAKSQNRGYVSLSAGGAGYMNNFGYLYINSELSSFMNIDSKFEQSLFCAKINYFSPLMNIGRWRFRNFLNIGYYNYSLLNADDYISVSENEVKGLMYNSFNASKKISFQIEPVLFTPINFYGFRPTIYAFYNGVYTNSRTDNKYVSAIGMGVKLHNKLLVFKTVRLQFAYYPTTPTAIGVSKFTAKFSDDLFLTDFETDKPDVWIEYMK